MGLIESILDEPISPFVCFIEGEGEVAEAVPSEEDNLASALAEIESEGNPAGESEDEDVELDIGPQKVPVKKVVKEAWDGLQKSVQARVEEAKAEKAAAAAERARTQEFQQVVAAVQDDVVTLKALDKQLEPYLKLTPADWMAWAEQDADAARKAQTGVQAMLMQRQNLSGQIQNKVTEVSTKQKAAAEEAQRRAEAEVSARIKDWSPEKRSEVVKGVAEYGLSEAEVAPFLTDHRAISILRDALAARAARARVAAKRPANESPPPAPMPRMRAGSSAPSSGLGDNVPIDKWAKNFAKSLRGG